MLPNSTSLSARVFAQIVAHVVPFASGGKINCAVGRAPLHNVCHKHGGPEHESEVLIAVAGVVVRELDEERAHYGHTCLGGLCHQGIKRWQHPVPQSEGLSHHGQRFLVHPRLGDSVVVVG